MLLDLPSPNLASDLSYDNSFPVKKIVENFKSLMSAIRQEHRRALLTTLRGTLQDVPSDADKL